MSDTVEVPFGDKPSDVAVLLLAAAEELDLDPHVVTASDGVFRAPADVVKKAGLADDDKSESKATKRTAKKAEK